MLPAGRALRRPGSRSANRKWGGVQLTLQERADGTFVHPLALCESETVGAGTRVWAFAHVVAGAVVGRNCNICGLSFIEDGAILGDGVVVKNGVPARIRTDDAEHETRSPADNVLRLASAANAAF